MKRQLIWLILAMSLMFNLFFIAGYMRSQSIAARADSPDAVADLVTRELNLSDSQAAVFTDLRSSLKKAAAEYDDSIALAQQDLVDELARDEPDLDNLRDIIDRQADLHRQRRLAGADRFGEFVSVLSTEQRRNLSGRLGRGPFGKHRQRRMLDQFDTNKDGKLDEQERAAAREFENSRRAERERNRRAELIKRYDINGDGELDESEQAAADEFERQRRTGMENMLRVQLLERFDANRNNVLDEDELDALRRWLSRPNHRGDVKRPPPPRRGR